MHYRANIIRLNVLEVIKVKIENRRTRYTQLQNKLTF